jgi:hypothetical protein
MHEQRTDSVVPAQTPWAACPKSCRAEPTRLPAQPARIRWCAACHALKPADHFATAGCCTSCGRRKVAVARRRQQRTLRQVSRRMEAGYRAFLTQHAPNGDGDDAA